MSSQPQGVQISTRAFLQSAAILAVLMLAAGVMTLVIPPGQYQRLEQDGRQLIVPDSFTFTPAPDYPAWRWITAPLELLGGPDGGTIIIIIVFLMLVGASFAVLESTGILRAALDGLVQRLGGRKYVLLLVVALFFMLIGGFFGIFEEVVPLVPLAVALAYRLGWDSLTGLGMSILATNLGFSAAVTNPFTLGVAQKLAGLPLFSGAPARLLIFLAVYAVLAVFLTAHARRVERRPQDSPVYAEDEPARRLALHSAAAPGERLPNQRRAVIWLGVFVALILLALVGGPLVPGLADLALPLVGLLFFIGGVGAGLAAGAGWGRALRAAGQGLAGIAPAIPLILMAASVKHIVASGGILDTLLYYAAGAFGGASPAVAVWLVFFLALGIEFFVASGSAKAFLLIPLIAPLADLVGLTRQSAVLAYIFGDGFSNLAYPTNPVLLICLGLTVVSYPRWLRWTLPLWGALLILALAVLAVAALTGYGPV